MAKRGPRRQQAPFQQKINGALFDHVAFDVICPLPTTVNGNRFILTMIDYFSMWDEAYALPNHKAETVADCHWILIRIHSANAPEFRGHVITQLKKMLSMKGTFTTPYSQKMYHDRDTTPCDFRKGDWVIYWHKPTAMQTLSSGWTDPYVVTEKVSVIDYRIQLTPTGLSKVVHIDQLVLDPWHMQR